MRSTPMETQLDVRPVAPKDRLEKVLGAWNGLRAGDSLLMTVDHDPKCMYYTLLTDYGESSFGFDYLRSGPIDWEVRVTRHK